MASIVISNNVSFGQMTNQIVSRMTGLNSSMPRLQEAIATASSGYTGVPGTEFEAPTGNMTAPTTSNLFGVQPDAETPGKKGTDYSYAVGQLQTAWAAFWTQAAPFIEQLDNGIPTY